MPAKVSYLSIKDAFERSECKLITPPDEYKGTRCKVRWICSCGREQESTMGAKMKAITDSEYTIQCRSCGIRKSTKAPTYDDFCGMLEKEGWVVLSPKEEFLNTKSKMQVKTKTGYETFTTYNRFQQGHRSKHDKDDRERNEHKMIEEAFKKRGFVLLDKYKNTKTPLRYKCKCGNVALLRYENFRNKKIGCKTCVRKYRVKIAPEVMKKQRRSSFRPKLYVFPSGRTEYILGYEGICIDHLLKEQNIPEDDITVNSSEMPIFRYTVPGEDIQRRYFPDIYILSTKTVIEVKSTWTYNKKREKNEAKWNAVANQGYAMEVYIYDNRKKLSERHYYGIESILVLSERPLYPPNFDFEKNWDRLCVPHLKSKKVQRAIKKGILATLCCKAGGYDVTKSPGYYSATDGFAQYISKLEEEIVERDNLYVVYDEDEDKWYEENEPETYKERTCGRTIISFDEAQERFYGRDGELTFEKRWQDIYYYIPCAECHVWNPTFSLALAECVYPNEKWEVIRGYYHTTVINKRKTLCFDIIYANLPCRGTFPNPLREALKKE